MIMLLTMLSALFNSASSIILLSDSNWLLISNSYSFWTSESCSLPLSIFLVCTFLCILNLFYSCLLRGYGHWIHLILLHLESFVHCWCSFSIFCQSWCYQSSVSFGLQMNSRSIFSTACDLTRCSWYSVYWSCRTGGDARLNHSSIRNQNTLVLHSMWYYRHPPVHWSLPSWLWCLPVVRGL